jgi:hypothetical protein
MHAAEAMAGIEAPTFSALVNLASDVKTFLRILTAQPEVQALAAGMNAGAALEAVRGRLRVLTDTSAEDGYEHPADAAMAAYLWLVSQKDPPGGVIAAERVLRCKQCWWARKVADHVRSASQAFSGEARPNGHEEQRETSAVTKS